MNNQETKHKYGLKRALHKLDATDQPLGRLAGEIALLLMGKNKPSYSPQTDCGDMVEIANAKKVKLTGKKIRQKKYYHHSGYPGGLKTTKLSDLIVDNPANAIARAVKNMLPKNRLQAKMIKRLKFVK